MTLRSNFRVQHHDLASLVIAIQVCRVNGEVGGPIRAAIHNRLIAYSLLEKEYLAEEKRRERE